METKKAAPVPQVPPPPAKQGGEEKEQNISLDMLKQVAEMLANNKGQVSVSELKDALRPEGQVVLLDKHSLIHFDPQYGDESTLVKFLSKRKKWSDYIGPNKLIEFVSQMYSTNVPDEIAHLRKSPLNGQEFWEKEFPPEYKELQKKHREYISRDPEEYN